MGRPKGSKNKTSPIEEKGNPDFNIADVEPTNILNDEPEVAQNVYTQEDRALDMELERMSREETLHNVEKGPAEPKKLKEHYVLLSEVVEDYKPAVTINELNFQVDQAKLNGCDSIVASDQIVKYYCKGTFPPVGGYFWYKDVRVFAIDAFEGTEKREKRSLFETESKTPMAVAGSRPA